MSQQYDNTNRGIFSKNERKEKDTHPDYKGTLNVEGVEYWLDGWIKERNDGSGKFLSVSVKRKDAAPSKAPAAKKPSKPESDADSDIPF